jgi:hypothetical protein
MCRMKRTGFSQGATKLPSHGGQPLNFTRNTGLQLGSGLNDGFNYVAPVVKYAPAQFQPGPVYRSGEAARVGHQPYNFDQKWVAYSTPRQTDYKYIPSYKGTQSTASYSLAQNTMSRLISMRSA